MAMMWSIFVAELSRPVLTSPQEGFAIPVTEEVQPRSTRGLPEGHTLISILYSGICDIAQVECSRFGVGWRRSFKNQHASRELQCQGANYWALSSASEAACNSAVLVFWLRRSILHGRSHEAIHGSLQVTIRVYSCLSTWDHEVTVSNQISGIAGIILNEMERLDFCFIFFI